MWTHLKSIWCAAFAIFAYWQPPCLWQKVIQRINPCHADFSTSDKRSLVLVLLCILPCRMRDTAHFDKRSCVPTLLSELNTNLMSAFWYLGQKALDVSCDTIITIFFSQCPIGHCSPYWYKRSQSSDRPSCHPTTIVGAAKRDLVFRPGEICDKVLWICIHSGSSAFPASLCSTCQQVPQSESSIVWAFKKVGMPPFFICHVEQRSCLPAVAKIVAKLEAERIGLSLIDIGPFLTSFRGSSFRQKSPPASLKISAFCFRLE